MKILYSLKEFSQKVGELAKVVGKSYNSVKVELVTYNDGHQRILFTTYIEGHGLQEGSTMEESIQKMKDKCIPPPEPTLANTDMEIDVENEVTEPANDIPMIN